MLYFGVAHPPTAACVAIYATTPAALQLGWLYVVTPALAGGAYCLLVQWGVARVLALAGRPKDAPPPPGVAKRRPLAMTLKALGPAWCTHAATPKTAFAGSLASLGLLSLGQHALRAAGATDALLYVGSAGALAT